MSNKSDSIDQENNESGLSEKSGEKNIQTIEKNNSKNEEAINVSVAIKLDDIKGSIEQTKNEELSLKKLKEKEELRLIEEKIKLVEKKPTFRERLVEIKNNITVEPVLGCFIVPSILSSLATTNLNLEKACRVNLGYSDEVCTALKLRQTADYKLQETEVQKLIASTQGWRSIIQTAIPTILMLFLGAWSDKTGKRKILMLMPIVGEILTISSNLLNTFFFYETNVEVTVFMEVIFMAVTGGWSTIFLGVFSYIGDVTTKETRTFRVGLLNLCASAGFPVAMGLSGILLRVAGYYGVFSISLTLYCINFAYCYFLIKDPPREKKQEESRGIIHSLKAFFDISHIKETFAVAFSKGLNNRRTRMMVVLLNVCLVFGPMMGEMSVSYIFTRFKFNWDEIKYSFYSTYSFIIHTIGTIFSITVFSKYLKFDDSVLGMISTMSKVCGAAVVAFAVTDFQMYMAPLVEILNGTSFISLRSIASKLVSGDELGKVNSLFGLCETMMPLLFAPMYSKVYIETLTVLPGAVFLMSSALALVASSLFGWLFYEHRQDIRRQRQELAGEKKDIET